MEIIFLLLVITLLFMFGYAQQEQGVFRTPGSITLSDDEFINGQ